ncbi:hypothetical protein C8J56DRAFT_783232 [Mycena floridula]|nr:hypothetical protein C8J56DRAFT_783232 [Mycena floridula]
MPLDEPYPQVSAPEIPALGQIPASSEAILAIDEEITPMARAPALAVEQYTSEDHAHILATKWLTTGQLAEMVRTTGLVYKKGKFSATETQQVRDAVEHYRLNRELSQEQLDSIIFPKNEKEKDNGFWTEVAMAVPQRPLVAVYHHVRRAFHPLKHQGKWMPAEDDRLRESVANYGQQWEKVSEHVGRRSADCRDRYRNHIVNQDIRVHGAWAKEEEEKLTKIVTEMTISQGRDMDNDVFWGVVSEKMGGTRGRQQCRIKWTDCLSQVVKNEGEKPRWGSQDAYVLVRKVDSLNIHDDTEIDWKTLSDPNWNFWSAHVLQRRWLTMKRSVKGWEEMAHQEIMDILKAKKVNIPPSSASTKRRKERKAASSAEAVVDSDPPPVAPSSTKSKKSKGKRKADT